MDILEKIAVRNVTQNVQAVIFTLAYVILDVNQDGKERTVLKVLVFLKKKTKQTAQFVLLVVYSLSSVFYSLSFLSTESD